MTEFDHEEGSRARTLFCSNLSENVTEKLLFELLMQGGPVDRVNIPKDRHGRSRNYGFVTYTHSVSIPYALKIFAGTQLFGRELDLKISDSNGGNNRNVCNIGDVFAGPVGGSNDYSSEQKSIGFPNNNILDYQGNNNCLLNTMSPWQTNQPQINNFIPIMLNQQQQMEQNALKFQQDLIALGSKLFNGNINDVNSHNYPSMRGINNNNNNNNNHNNNHNNNFDNFPFNHNNNMGYNNINNINIHNKMNYNKNNINNSNNNYNNNDKMDRYDSRNHGKPMNDRITDRFPRKSDVSEVAVKRRRPSITRYELCNNRRSPPRRRISPPMRRISPVRQSNYKSRSHMRR